VRHPPYHRCLSVFVDTAGQRVQKPDKGSQQPDQPVLLGMAAQVWCVPRDRSWATWPSLAVNCMHGVHLDLDVARAGRRAPPLSPADLVHGVHPRAVPHGDAAEVGASVEQIAAAAPGLLRWFATCPQGQVARTEAVAKADKRPFEDLALHTQTLTSMDIYPAHAHALGVPCLMPPAQWHCNCSGTSGFYVERVAEADQDDDQQAASVATEPVL
jgi:hypothetical protein